MALGPDELSDALAGVLSARFGIGGGGRGAGAAVGRGVAGDVRLRPRRSTATPPGPLILQRDRPGGTRAGSGWRARRRWSASPQVAACPCRRSWPRTATPTCGTGGPRRAMDRRRPGGGRDARPPASCATTSTRTARPATGRPVRRARWPRSTASRSAEAPAADRRRPGRPAADDPRPARPAPPGLRARPALAGGQPAARPAGHRSSTATSATATSSSAPTACGRCSTGSSPTSATRSRTSAGSACGRGASARPTRPAGSAAATSCSPPTRRRAAARSTPAELHWWEVLGTLKWGVICMMQATRPPVRPVPLGRAGRHRPPGLRDRARPPGAAAVTEPHDVPDLAGLVEAVREFLEGDVAARHHGPGALPRPGRHQRPADGRAGAGPRPGPGRRPTPSGWPRWASPTTPSCPPPSAGATSTTAGPRCEPPSPRPSRTSWRSPTPSTPAADRPTTETVGLRRSGAAQLQSVRCASGSSERPGRREARWRRGWRRSASRSWSARGRSTRRWRSATSCSHALGGPRPGDRRRRQRRRGRRRPRRDRHAVGRGRRHRRRRSPTSSRARSSSRWPTPWPRSATSSSRWSRPAGRWRPACRPRCPSRRWPPRSTTCRPRSWATSTTRSRATC